MSEAQDLFDHEEYLEQMAHYYQVFLDSKNVFHAAKTLNVDVEEIWEAIHIHGGNNG